MVDGVLPVIMVSVRRVPAVALLALTLLVAVPGTATAAAPAPAAPSAGRDSGRPVTDPRAHVVFDDTGTHQAAAAPRAVYVPPLGASRASASPHAQSPGATTRPVEIFGFAQSGEVTSGAWRSDIQLNILTTLAYFGVNMNGDGTLVTSDSGYGGWLSDQMTALMNTAHARTDRVVLTVKAFSSAGIASITGDENTRQAAISTIIHQLQTRGGDGVNIDFEGFDSSVAGNFATFIRELHSALHSQVPSQTYLTVDTYASAASGGTMFDISALAPSVDAFDVMAYDITSPGSSTAGPVAPLNGQTYADTNTVADYLALIPATQLILGVPYYGYKWSTTTSARPGPRAPSQPGAAADTYAATFADFSCALQLQQNWDDTAASPWATWYSPATNDPCGGNHNAWREMYYENAQSLSAKYDLVNAHQLKGIGIWALGYDTGHGELWNLIASKLRGYPLTPSVPTSVVTTSSAAGSATLSWGLPEFPAGNDYPVQTYVVTPYDQWGNASSSVNVPGSQLSYTATNLPDAQPVYFTVSAIDSVGSGPAATGYSVTPVSATPPRAGSSSATDAHTQYRLPNSDGATWQYLGGAVLPLSYTPASSGEAVITLNSDLWTAAATYNIDVGLSINGIMLGWKEAGGYRPFSPNAAFLQLLVPVTLGTTYTITPVWKSNRPGLGTSAWAGAGSAGAFSPTRLSVQLESAFGVSGNTTGATVATTRQIQDVWPQPGSDGTQWMALDRTLQFSITPTATQQYLLTGNSDLWTETPGYNQDVGIMVNGTVVAWKESGGAAAYSPNAAYVQALYPMTAGQSYQVALVWKTNRAAPGVTIVAGAGSSGNFSPSRLSAYPVSGQSLADTITTQPRSSRSDGQTWLPIDNTGLTTLMTVGLYDVSGNADLWTMQAGVNVDIGVQVDGVVVTWKEAGGWAAYAPCAAFVDVPVTLGPGPHTISLVWKTNAATSAPYLSGAGPSSPFSPTSLMLIPLG